MAHFPPTRDGGRVWSHGEFYDLRKREGNVVSWPGIIMLIHISAECLQIVSFHFSVTHILMSVKGGCNLNFYFSQEKILKISKFQSWISESCTLFNMLTRAIV